MTLLLVTLLFCEIDNSIELLDYVDIIELNHYYDGQARHVFDQYIFWEWNDRRSRHDVVAWIMAKDYKVYKKDDYCILRFKDQTSERRRVVKSKIFRDTIHQEDIELEERKILPTADRKGLSKWRK